MGSLTVFDPLGIAEDGWSYVRPWDNQVMDDHGDLVLRCGTSSRRQDASVLRVRLEAASAERRIDEVRAWMAAHGQREFTWWLGASKTPDDLESRLLARGAVADPDNPVMTPMALDHEPPPALAAIEVALVRTLEEYARCREISAEGSDMSEQNRAGWVARVAEEWSYAQSDGAQRFIARIDGEPAAYGVLLWLIVGPPYLGGATTATWARGRGAYQALLRARWDAAVSAGATTVVTLGDKNARPVLEHFGFESGPPVRLLVDHAGA